MIMTHANTLTPTERHYWFLKLPTEGHSLKIIRFQTLSGLSFIQLEEWEDEWLKVSCQTSPATCHLSNLSLPLSVCIPLLKQNRDGAESGVQTQERKRQKGLGENDICFKIDCLTCTHSG